MIVSFRHEWLSGFFVDDVHSRRIPSDLEERLFRKLQMLDDAMSDQDFAGATKQSLRKAAWQAEGLSFDPRQ
jgi:proteic killer suppression protein